MGLGGGDEEMRNKEKREKIKTESERKGTPHKETTGQSRPLRGAIGKRRERRKAQWGSRHFQARTAPLDFPVS